TKVGRSVWGRVGKVVGSSGVVVERQEKWGRGAGKVGGKFGCAQCLFKSWGEEQEQASGVAV
nr:hypothetical protein [Tanacetum cinerariifolium]